MKAKPCCLFWMTLIALFFVYDVFLSSLPSACAGNIRLAEQGRGDGASAASISLATNVGGLLSRRSARSASTAKTVKIAISPLVIPDPAIGSHNVSPSSAMPDHPGVKAMPRHPKKPKEPLRERTGEPKLRFYPYYAEAGDNLKTIAQKYYGSYLYFPVILMHNPQIQTFEIEEGAEVSIIENALEAIRLFRTHTVIDEGRIFWIYTARKNDTLEGIGKKFYQTRYVNNPLVNMNPESRIKPGEKIRILLN